MNNNLLKLRLHNHGDFVRFRNLLFYKLFNNTTVINKYIDYSISDKTLFQYTPATLIDISKISGDLISANTKYVGKMAISNRFDLLGSGWVRYDFSNDSNKNGEISWNVDIKSGYVWPIDNLDERECINSPEGTDIKNAWELGRLNYIVPLSLSIIAEKDFELKQNGIEAYKRIVTDFYSNNPVGKGVNWVLPMEAAIRISNILISYDILKQSDENCIFDESFDFLLTRCIYEHIKFIWNNLEKNIFGGKNGNHYYSNIVGLLFATGYLKKRNSFCERIFQYARKEFIKETKLQFYEEGGHFEQSTGYFRLVAEMLIFASAILLRNGCELPDSVLQRIENNKKLAEILKRTDGTFYSFGDCDSGRFIKTGFYGKYIKNREAENKYQNLNGYCSKYDENELYFMEDDSSLNSLINYSNGVINALKRENTIEENIISLLAGKRIDLFGKSFELKTDKVVMKQGFLKDYPVHKQMIINDGIKQNEILEHYLYKGMGIYLLKTDSFSLLFRFGNNECVGHSHNDSLHYEYEIKGKHFEEDPGTYTYTGYPKLRNEYRSTMVHNVPQYGVEQRYFNGFWGYATSDFREIVEYTEDKIAVRYKNDSYEHIRRILIANDKIIVEDYGKKSFEVEKRKIDLKSPSYGYAMRSLK